MLTRRKLCVGLLALAATGVGGHRASAEKLKQVTLRVTGMT